MSPIRTWDDKTIERLAFERMGHKSLPELIVRQGITEWGLRITRGVNFRKKEVNQTANAYGAMNIGEFEGINARQAWTNWRTVAKNLNGVLSDEKPLKAIDLCCGVGQSTEVLGCYLPKGSQILGIEQNPEFVKDAYRRLYVDQNGDPVRVSFHAQSALETFHDANGNPVESESIDLVNSSGVVGHHFRPDMTLMMLHEVSRVLKPGGYALIDSGPWGTTRGRVKEIGSALGWEFLRSNRSHILDPLFQVLFRKPQR